MFGVHTWSSGSGVVSLIWWLAMEVGGQLPTISLTSNSRAYSTEWTLNELRSLVGPVGSSWAVGLT